MDGELAHRLHFAFTIVYHYLFPQLTMGLALLIVILKTMALRTGDAHFNRAARFWARIFGVNFLMGVVTGIPMEFQFGTNWARFSEAAGGVIGQTLAMEGMFSFFLESSFLGLFLFAEKKLSPRAHWFAAVCVFAGSWMSGWFIVATNAWMQHPVGYDVAHFAATGEIVLNDYFALFTNPWLLRQYPHTMLGAVVTGSFVMAGTGAYYLLSKKHVAYGKTFVRIGVIVGAIASTLSAMPTGDLQAKMVSKHKPISFAAMEGHFHTEKGAAIVLIGQPNMETMTLDNAFHVPWVLSFITHQRWNAEVKGLTSYPKEEWPDNVPLLYYAYHIMVGLGTIFIGIMLLAALQLKRGKLYDSPPLLWTLMLAFPFPYIANTAGWVTAEVGRQPWLIHGLFRTSEGYSDNVSSGNVLFSLIGFAGMYSLLSIIFLLLIVREVREGPDAEAADDLGSAEARAATEDAEGASA